MKKKKYNTETQKWISIGQQLPYGNMLLSNGVRLLSAVSDTNLIVADEVIGSGFAIWRIVNENTRVRKLDINVELEQHRAFWSRKSDRDNPIYQFSVKKELEPTCISDEIFRELIFSEELAVSSSSTECLLSKDNLSGKIMRSNFRVSETHNNKSLVDIGIITIRDDELQAVINRFKPKDTVQRSNRTYAITRIAAKSGQNYKVAIIQCPEQGQGSGQKTADDLIDDLNPLWIFLIGIAGAIPSQEFTLGDVIAASRLHDFTLTAWKDNAQPEYQQRGGGMHPSVIDLLNSLKFRKNMLNRWNSIQSIASDSNEIS
jgi:hypothetical protein